jgi:hypothetical protein
MKICIVAKDKAVIRINSELIFIFLYLYPSIYLIISFHQHL